MLAGRAAGALPSRSGIVTQESPSVYGGAAARFVERVRFTQPEVHTMMLLSFLLAAGLTHVPSAQPKIAGASAPNELSPELREIAVVQGAHRVENPLAAAGVTATHYGYHADGPLLPAPGDLPSPTHKVEATKTEPDKNTYLVLRDQRGADPSYDYGRRFLFQGHENGARSASKLPVGTITRVNLDADGAHRVTVLAVADATGTPLPVFDGSTWDPWANRLLFTAEGANGGGVWQATLDVPSTVEPLTGILGQGGYEGIQNDGDGNLWIVEDSGGSTASTAPHARQPNSFVFRFLPATPRDLKRGGKLQGLQVLSRRTGQPIVFHPGQAAADIFSDDVADLHTCGLGFRTRWVTVHDTASDGVAPFNANAAAKAAGATPFKRPENGAFRPGSRFREFFFTETGDTNALSEAGASFGGFGGIFRLSQRASSADEGTLTLFFAGDVAHTGLDNIAFWDRDHLIAVEDAGDGLHTQRGAFDSAYLFDADEACSAPVRILALGRDPSATLDSAFSGMPGFLNDGDNEITGIHVSDGDATQAGILGAKLPHPFEDGWRVFYTQQHGDNITWEIVPARRHGRE
jgi:hypothetical protein